MDGNEAGNEAKRKVEATIFELISSYLVIYVYGELEFLGNKSFFSY